ncbi:MAG: glycosyltransferase, partial [Candidatus Sericytochromatia bacterium]
EDVLFTCVARLMPVKNHAMLIEAFARGLGGAPDAHLLLVGEGELRPALERQVAEAGLTGRIHLMGKRTDIPETLAAADAFVLASDWEGNPLSVLEAMAAGKPVVATAVGGVPELVTAETGRLVPPGDTVAMAEALKAAYALPDVRQRMGERAALRAEAAFDVAAMARAYEALYTRLLSREGAIGAQMQEVL